MRHAALFILILALCAVGCSNDHDSPTEPDQIINLAGQWAGNIQDSAYGTGSCSASISQTGSDIKGNWTVLYSQGSVNNGGTLEGKVKGKTVTITMYGTTCSYVVTANIDASTISGTYKIPCGGSGSIMLEKR